MTRDIGKYRLGVRLGGGGMAEVFRAHLMGAEGFARAVAIKRVLPGYSSDPAFGDMFVGEARIASLLAHPNVVPVLDFDRDEEGQLFIVMELVNGKDLRTLSKAGLLPRSVTVYVVTELLRALDYAHNLRHDGRAMGIVHRDVTPHNVLLSWHGAVKLSDFGIAKAVAESPITKTGVVKGKAAYLSPEQALAGDMDGRSDLFSLGIILHEMLTGERLFGVEGGAPDMVVVRRVLNLEIPSPKNSDASLSDALVAVCLKMLARDPADRFRSAQSALEALLQCPEASPRGQIELAALMETRFPGEAPVRERITDATTTPTEPEPPAPRNPIDSHPTELEAAENPVPPREVRPEDMRRTIRVDVEAHLERVRASQPDQFAEAVTDRPADTGLRRAIDALAPPEAAPVPLSASMPSYPPHAMKPRRWPWLVAIAILVAIGGWAAVQLASPPPEPEPAPVRPVPSRD